LEPYCVFLLPARYSCRSNGALYTQQYGDANIQLNGSGDTVSVGNDVSITVNGSGDTISDGYSGATIAVTGSGDVINAAEGSTVTLSVGDTGDTINMVGGNIVLGASVSGITIVGTGDAISGAGASLAGPVSVWHKTENSPNGPFVITGTIIPAVIYDAGDIPDLVSYFEANPYLSQDQIQAAESDSNYTANLDSYLSSATLYGSPNALPSNVLGMLDGYSSIYLALIGVPAEDLSEDTYIEQQIGWSEENYPMLATVQVEGVNLGIDSILQNLMPVLESTNTNTQSLVSEAIGLLEFGAAGASAGNQAPILGDTTAEMLLGMAETPGYSASTSGIAEVQTPGRDGHWQIVVDGDGTYTQIYKSPPLIQTVLSDLDTYVAPIIDIAAVLTANPELLGINALVAAGVQVAATAVSLIQAGQDFAAGDDLQGVLGVTEAIGGALQGIGAAEGLSVGACSTTNGLQQFGEALSEAGAAAQGIDGVVAGAESGNILAAITSGLGGVAGVAGLANDSTIQQYAAVGEELGSTALAAQRGDILAALDGLVQAAQSSGALTPIVQDVSVMVDAFEIDVYDPLAGAVSWLWQATSSEINTIEQWFVNVVNPQQGPGTPFETGDLLEYAQNGQSDAGSGLDAPTIHIAANLNQLVGNSFPMPGNPSDTTCVLLIEEGMPGSPTTPYWSAGAAVVGNTSLLPGTPIATFDGPNGSYGGHAAIYMGQAPDGGLMVIDQYNGTSTSPGKPFDTEHEIYNAPGHSYVNTASNYHVVLWANNAPAKVFPH
jgi:hypothetical protein